MPCKGCVNRSSVARDDSRILGLIHHIDHCATYAVHWPRALDKRDEYVQVTRIDLVMLKHDAIVMHNSSGFASTNAFRSMRCCSLKIYTLGRTLSARTSKFSGNHQRAGRKCSKCPARSLKHNALVGQTCSDNTGPTINGASQPILVLSLQQIVLHLEYLGVRRFGLLDAVFKSSLQ
jgi:hypothetical protein